MSTDRLAQLRHMLVEEPGDLFIRYAIALELKRAGEMKEAVDGLKAILAEEPKHIASYYQLALMQAEMGHTQEAIRTCDAGALECLVTGDRKARAELLELREALVDED